jgi:DMSO reductase family type II enzyme chaperone
VIPLVEHAQRELRYGASRTKTWLLQVHRIRQVMEDLLRFYEHFGLALSLERRELPDHLTVELEFLHYLTFKEVAALTRGLDPSPYRRAQRDFLERHPTRWLPRLRAKISQERALPPFTALVGTANDFVHADLAHLRRLLKDSS